MGETIETQRLTLRRMHEDDARWINACVRDPRVHRNVGKIPPGQTMVDTRAFLAHSDERWDSGEAYNLVIDAGDGPAGIIGGGFGGYGPAYDVGYWLAPDAWGRGYATEATRAYVDWLENFIGLRSMTAGYFLDNPASGRVLRKCGFLPAGRSKYHCLGRNAVVDCVDMARIA